jgi:hypothetical protein
MANDRQARAHAESREQGVGTHDKAPAGAVGAGPCLGLSTYFLFVEYNAIYFQWAKKKIETNLECLSPPDLKTRLW